MAGPLIIGFSGRAGVGKTYAANVLQRQQPGYMPFSFADPVYSYCCSLVGLRDALTDGQRADFKGSYFGRWGMGGRELLQWFGTDVCRARNPDVWVQHAERALSDNSAFERIVYDDVRFPNEAEWIKSKGGHVIRIMDGRGGPPESDHSSETALKDTDWGYYTDKIVNPFDSGFDDKVVAACCLV